MNRRIIIMLLILVMILLTTAVVIVITTTKDNIKDNKSDSDSVIESEYVKPEMAQLKIATTVPIIAEFIGIVRGNNNNIILLDKNNVDINKLNELDLLIYISDEGYDGWLGLVIQEIGISEQVRILRLADNIENYKDYGWMSINNAIRMLNDISLVISELDLYYSDVYNDNIQQYIYELDSIRADYYNVISSGELGKIYIANETDETKIKNLLDEFSIEYDVVDGDEEQSNNTITFKNIEDYSENMTYIDILNENINILKGLIN